MHDGMLIHWLRNTYLTVLCCLIWSVMGTHGAEYRQLHTSTENNLGSDGRKAIAEALEINTSRQVCAIAS